MLSVEPRQIGLGPVSVGIGKAFTVTTVFTLEVQPFVVTVYVMVVVPGATGVTKPVDGSMVAIVLSLLLHTPPPVASESEPVVLIHTLVLPVMAPTTGSGFTVITTGPNVDIQPLLFVISTVTD